MESGSSGKIILLIVLICFSAFFSMSESALTSLNKLKLKQMSDEKVKGANRVIKLHQNSRKMLNTILVGNNFVNILASSLATSIAISIIGNNSFSVFISTLLITAIILIFAEVVPKTYAAQNSEKVSLKVSTPISFIMWLLAPFVFLLNIISGFLVRLLGGDSEKTAPLITEFELKEIINIGHEHGVLKEEEKNILNNVFEFYDSTAEDIMTPRTDIVAIPSDANNQDIKKAFEDKLFTRLPVYSETIDNIIGIIHLRDFIFAEDIANFNLNNYIRKPYYTYENKSIFELFNSMRTNRVPMTVVLDEYGGTSGIVTIEDIVEEIVGRVSDEYSKAEDIEVVGENEYIIDGIAKIEDVNDMLGTNFESEDFDSIGGYVIGLCGNIPQAGEVIESDGIKFVIEEMDKNRITEVRIHI